VSSCALTVVMRLELHILAGIFAVLFS